MAFKYADLYTGAVLINEDGSFQMTVIAFGDDDTFDAQTSDGRIITIKTRDTVYNTMHIATEEEMTALEEDEARQALDDEQAEQALEEEGVEEEVSDQDDCLSDTQEDDENGDGVPANS